jgi:4-amino-4-deoxy-L-arabinose transferase-like glycosyltransferase
LRVLTFVFYCFSFRIKVPLIIKFLPISVKMPPIKKASALQFLLILIIVTGGAILRLAYNSNTSIDHPIRADAAHHVTYATNLLSYRTFSKDRAPNPVPDSYWSPGYPLFLAAVIKLSEALSVDAYNLILLCQVLLGVGTLIICYLLAKTFLPGFWALLPPGLVAISPHLVSSGSYVLTETLFGFTLILALYVLVRAVACKRRLYWFYSGVIFGVAYLVNPVSLLLAPLLAAFLVFSAAGKAPEDDKRQHVRNIAVLVVPLIIIVGSWSIRSAISVPSDQPTASSRLLTNMIIGLYPDWHEKWRDNLQQEKKVALPGSGVDKSYEAFFKELAAKIDQDPMKVLAWYTVHKPVVLWDWDILVGFGDIYIYPVNFSLYHISIPAIFTYSFMYGTHYWILLGALVGLGFLLAESKENRLVPAMLYISLIYISLVYVVSQSEPRYSIPLRAELYLCFTYFLWRTFAWIGRLRQRSKLNVDQPSDI